jgi:hypothetical protein
MFFLREEITYEKNAVDGHLSFACMMVFSSNVKLFAEPQVSSSKVSDFKNINGDSGSINDLPTISEKDQLLGRLMSDDTLTQDQISNIAEKLYYINVITRAEADKAASAVNSESVGGSNNAIAAVSYTAATINVPNFKQETTYYCGPATTKQTMQYINGSSQTQSQIASALGTTSDGTDGTKIVTYLNNNQKRNSYTIATDLSVDGFKDRIYKSVAVFNSPMVLRVKFTNTSGNSWKYSTTGHFMNVSGFTQDINTVRVTDPNIKNVNPSASDQYYVSFSELRQAELDHFAQHYYW